MSRVVPAASPRGTFRMESQMSGGHPALMPARDTGMWSQSSYLIGQVASESQKAGVGVELQKTPTFGAREGASLAWCCWSGLLQASALATWERQNVLSRRAASQDEGTAALCQEAGRSICGKSRGAQGPRWGPVHSP